MNWNKPIFAGNCVLVLLLRDLLFSCAHFVAGFARIQPGPLNSCESSYVCVRLRRVVFAAVCLLAAGCDSEVTTREQDSVEMEETTQNESSQVPPAEITLATADVAAYDEVIEKHKGKVVLVDFWATWCGPCKVRFPHTVKLGQELEDKGFAVVSMSLDGEDSRDSVLDFLRQQNAAFDNLISQYGAGVESFNEFQIAGGAVPFYKLYDRNGTLRFQFCGLPEGVENVESIDNIDARVKELLAELAQR